MRYKDLEEKIFEWADDKQLLEPENLENQNEALRETFLNLREGIKYKVKGFKEFVDTSQKIRKTEDVIESSLGEVLLELIILAEINGISLENSLTTAFNNKNLIIKRN